MDVQCVHSINQLYLAFHLISRYLFNDAEVKPFDPCQIASECFGGEMTVSTLGVRRCGCLFKCSAICLRSGLIPFCGHVPREKKFPLLNLPCFNISKVNAPMGKLIKSRKSQL